MSPAAAPRSIPWPMAQAAGHASDLVTLTRPWTDARGRAPWPRPSDTSNFQSGTLRDTVSDVSLPSHTVGSAYALTALPSYM